MKKMLISLVIMLIFCGCDNSVQPTEPPEPQTQSPADIVDNSETTIDSSKVMRIDEDGFLPVSAASVKNTLSDFERFNYGQLIHEQGGIDVWFTLDDWIAQVFFSIEPRDRLHTISYNFEKATALDGDGDSIRWGLDLLLQIFEIKLTDEMWAEITRIAEMPKSDDPMGTDYDLCAHAGVRVICANLSENIQIDIKV